MEIEPANISAKNDQMVDTVLDPQLVREIADRVYALMLRDMKIENERLVIWRANTPYHFGDKP